LQGSSYGHPDPRSVNNSSEQRVVAHHRGSERQAGGEGEVAIEINPTRQLNLRGLTQRNCKSILLNPAISDRQRNRLIQLQRGSTLRTDQSEKLVREWSGSEFHVLKID